MYSNTILVVIVIEINGPGCDRVICETHKVCVVKSSSVQEKASCVDRKLTHFRYLRLQTGHQIIYQIACTLAIFVPR